MDHLSTMAQTLILLSTSEFNMVRLSDQHSTGSSIMPQKRNPCSMEAIKAKTAFAHGTLVSLLSVGKGLFVGYNRDTQWTKYWIIDLVEETKPALTVMADVIRLLQVHKAQMLKQAEEGFAGATSLMEWMVASFRLPLRKAKGVMEKAVKYSEKEGKGEVTFQSLKKALREMKIDLSLSEQDVKKVQRPERILSQNLAIGTPSAKRVQENVSSLREKVKRSRAWLTLRKRRIEKAKELMGRMERKIWN